MPVPSIDPAKWLKRVQPSAVPRVQLYCLAYAGGGASVYRPWKEGLPADIQVNAVQLPGHEERLMEPPIECARAAGAALAEVIESDRTGPYALFGYSMGALVAFEAARELRRRGVPAPQHLFAAAMRAPQVPPTNAGLHALPEDEFLAEVGRRYEAVPAEVVAEPDLLALLLPTLRADMAVCDTYTFSEEPRLECPVSVLAGEGDANITPEQLRGWGEVGVGPAEEHWFPGGHFFMRDQLAEVHAVVIAGLQGAGA
jgi:medium-chain acyl-[acyl-carrier-protein] hydrolase